MTAYAFVDGSTASEIFQPTSGEGFTNPFTGVSYPPNYLALATQAEREAEGIWPIEEAAPVVFPDKVASQTLVVSAGPVVTRVSTPVALSLAEKRAAIMTVVDEAETTKLNGSFVGINGLFWGTPGYSNYPLTPAIRDAMSLYGTLAVNATLGRRAAGWIDWNGQPANNATVTINGVTITFVTGSPSANQVQIGATSSDTVTALAAALNSHTDAKVNHADYRKQGTDVLYITHKTFSTNGNGFTLAKSTSPDANCDLSGATLTGGRDPAEAADLTWISVYTPHAGEWFGVDDIDSNRHFLDAYEAIRLIRDMTFFVAAVTFYAASQRRAALDAEGVSDHAALLTIWDDVNDPSNWDPGTPPNWP